MPGTSGAKPQHTISPKDIAPAIRGREHRVEVRTTDDQDPCFCARSDLPSSTGLTDDNGTRGAQQQLAGLGLSSFESSNNSVQLETDFLGYFFRSHLFSNLVVLLLVDLQICGLEEAGEQRLACRCTREIVVR